MTSPKSTIGEDLTPQVDGATALFTIAGGPFIAGTLNVYHNGSRLRSGYDFNETGSLDGFVLEFTPRVGDSVLVQYEIEDFGAGFPLVIAYGQDPT